MMGLGFAGDTSLSTFDECGSMHPLISEKGIGWLSFQGVNISNYAQNLNKLIMILYFYFIVYPNTKRAFLN